MNLFIQELTISVWISIGALLVSIGGIILSIYGYSKYSSVSAKVDTQTLQKSKEAELIVYFLEKRYYSNSKKKNRVLYFCIKNQGQSAAYNIRIKDLLLNEYIKKNTISNNEHNNLIFPILYLERDKQLIFPLWVDLFEFNNKPMQIMWDDNYAKDRTKETLCTVLIKDITF